VKTYFISGLGADRKAFYRLRLPAGYEPVYLDWIAPQTNESLKDYAQRFSSLINDKEEFVLIGLSFGGMIASEIARIKTPRKLILLSSVSASHEMPWYFRVAGKMRMQKIIPVAVYKRATLLNHFMGSRNKNDKALVSSFVKQTDPQFIRWSINAMLKWKQHDRLKGVIHIHGNKDKLLPLRYTNASHTIKNGRHLMVLTKFAEINRILREVLPVVENQLSSN
jgi:pimeloyl-ACP methyl ester carboxylesterase